MRHVICCWCDTDANRFENHVPVLFSGSRNLRLGFSNEIDLLFLSGYELLAEDYKSGLREVGYTLHDLARIYSEVESKYSSLQRFSNHVIKYFLRWLVISAYLGKEPIIHYDGDIVFNEDPVVIGKLLKGRTFVLQGCPALTVITDQSWFSQYKDHLAVFANDIEGYSTNAWKERVGSEITERGKWAGRRDSEIFLHDQDFLSHLIHTDRIVQDRPSEILQDLRSYIVFENPLYMDGYENNLHDVLYRRNRDIDYIDSRRVLFWHMQGYFIHYLGKYIVAKRFIPKNCITRMSNDVEKKDLYSYLYGLFCRHLRREPLYRLDVYRYFFEQNDLSEVLNNRIWWRPGVFASL